jgi:ankyrin repeat protein
MTMSLILDPLSGQGTLFTVNQKCKLDFLESDGSIIQRLTQFHDNKSPISVASRWNMLTLLSKTFTAICSQETIHTKLAFDVNKTNQSGQTALHVAAQHGNLQSVRALILSKANLDVADVDGKCVHDYMPPDSELQELYSQVRDGNCNLLMLAAKQSDGQQARLSLISSDNVNDPNDKGQSALHFAALEGNTNLVSALLGAKAQLEMADIEGNTPLCNAAIGGNPAIVASLLSAKADVFVINKAGLSPLQLCTSDLASFLLKTSGADGWTPLMVAAESGNSLVQKYFKVRQCLMCIQNKSDFPLWLQNDLQYYSNLKQKEIHWTWEAHESLNLVFKNDNKQVYKKATSLAASTHVAVLGSEEFHYGIHSWNLKVDNVHWMCAGVAKGVEGCLDASPTDGSAGFEYLLAFASNGAIYAHGKKHVINSVTLTGFSSGQILTFELDTHEHSLVMKVDGILAVVVFNIEDQRVRPYICMRFSECCHLLSNVSRVESDGLEQSILEHDDWQAGFDNALWSADLDAKLIDFLVPGAVMSDPILDSVLIFLNQV